VLALSRGHLRGRRRSGLLLRLAELVQVRLDRPTRDQDPATQPHGAQVASSDPVLDGLQADPEGPRCLPRRQVLAARAAGRLAPGERLGQHGLDGPGTLGLALSVELTNRFLSQLDVSGGEHGQVEMMAAGRRPGASRANLP
jgi:hypothetical protein